jgi:poly(hydroxyalkanoate) depolymerase family esterase
VTAKANVFPAKDAGMKTLFGAAMRKAAELTRRENVLEATQAIQRALSGQGPAEAADEQRRENPRLSAVAERSAEVRPSHRNAETESTENPVVPRNAAAILASAALARESIVNAWEQLRQADPSSLDLRLKQPAPARKAPAAPDRAAFVTRAFASDAGARDYKLYVPSYAGGGKRPLIVMLHGCTQDPDDFALGTGMNLIAEEQGFVVAYPKQSKRANQSGCWNWFNAGDQIRDAGEPGIIAGMTRSIMAEFDIDPKRIYVAGLSAGGAMATIMSATYPELYGAAGIHSGLPYRSATDAPSAFAAMRGHASPLANAQRASHRHSAKGRVRTIVFHGDSDPTVHPSNAEMIVAGARAGLTGATEQTHRGRSVGGRAYARTVIADASGAPHVEYWAIEGLGHAWSGGSLEGSYTDPKGPDASREMLRFFLEKPTKRRISPQAAGRSTERPIPNDVEPV